MKRKINSLEGVFREKLVDYSQPAPDDVWLNIELKLNKNKSRFIPFYKVAAAVIAICAVGSVYFYSSNNKLNINNVAENKLVVAPKNIDSNKINKNYEEGTLNIKSNDNIIDVQEKHELAIDSEVDSEVTSVPVTENTTNFEKQEAAIDAKLEDKIATVESAENIAKVNEQVTLAKMESHVVAVNTKKLNPSIIQFKKNESVPDLSSLPDIYSITAFNEPIEEEKKTGSKWVIGGEFTPLYSYRYLSAGNDKEYYNSVESPVMSYTGGVNVQYKLLERLTIQSGVYYSSMGQSIDQMSVYSNSAYNNLADANSARFVNNYLLQNSTGDIKFNSPYIFIDEKLSRVDNQNDYKVNADVSDPLFNGLDADIQQNFSYIEVPVLVRYKLIDKRLDFNIIGGIGANFLVGNNVYLIYDSKKEIIGETSGVNNVNYSGCIGFGIDYPIMKRINIRLEPSIKYYLNEMNSNSSVESHPYSFGIYTGFNYSF